MGCGLGMDLWPEAEVIERQNETLGQKMLAQNEEEPCG